MKKLNKVVISSVKNILLLCCAMVVLFIGGEIVARILWKMEIISVDSIGPVDRSFVEELNNPDLQYVLKKNIDVTVREGYRIKTNAEGFRAARDYSLEKQDGVYRIAVIGDSVSFGLGVNNDQTYPAVLEELLTPKVKAMGYRGVEVINAGVPAYHLLFYREMYRRSVRKYDPDLIVVGYCFNDAQDTYYAYKYAAGMGVKSAIPIPAFLRRLLRRSVFYISLAHELNKFRAVLYNKHELKKMRKENVGDNDKDFLAGLDKKNILGSKGAGEKNPTRRLKEDCPANFFIIKNGLSGDAWDYLTGVELPAYQRIFHDDTVPVLFVLFPTFAQLDDTYPCIDDEQRLKTAIETSGFYCMNLFEAYKGYPEKTISLEPIHPNVAGNQIAAKAISDYIADYIVKDIR